MAKNRSFLDQLYFGQQPEAPLRVSVADEIMRSGRGKPRNLNARVPRGPSISAPEPNKFEDIYNSIGQLASRIMPTGGDTRTTYQRGADYGQNIASALNWAPVSPHGLERGLMHGMQQMSGDRPEGVDTEDYINLFAPGAGYAIGAAAPLVRRIPGVDRALNYLRHTDEMPVDPDYIEGISSVRPPADLAVPRLTGPAPAVADLAVPRLTGPAPALALPAPGPGLPPLAAKPRGGQWWPDVSVKGVQFPAEPGSVDDILNGLMDNTSPEAAARFTAAVTPEHVDGYRDWLQRAVAKYYKTDFGSPSDPMRELAARGLHYDPDMTPEKWKDTVNSYLMEDPIGAYTVPGTSGYNPEASQELLAAAPWLAKQPVTDMLYGIQSGGLDLSHFNDELGTALRVGAGDESSIPLDFAVRPDSLGRMSFPQAAERVGKINQYRAEERARASAAAANSPAISTFKEYPDDPRGMRWVEFKHPEWSDEMYAPEERAMLAMHEQQGTSASPGALSETQAMRREETLKDALRLEGDTMGVCVGDCENHPQYYRGVMSGDKRIFSLRDAKGEPHVTVETSPSRKQYFFSDVATAVGPMQADAWLNEGATLAEMVERAGLRANPHPDNIIQIKGKGNRAPKDDYLPFVQDFVKSGQWGNVGDLRNTQLVKLPDGRYITQQQYDDVVRGDRLDDNYQSYDFSARGFPRDPSGMAPEDWQQFSHHFEGYAIGGRVSADRCFTRNPLSVRR